MIVGTHRSSRSQRLFSLVALATIAAMLLNLAPGILPGTKAPEALAHNLQTRMVYMFLDLDHPGHAGCPHGGPWLDAA